MLNEHKMSMVDEKVSRERLIETGKKNIYKRTNISLKVRNINYNY